MKYKAIIFDLDRTLLRNDKSISEYTVSVLKKCREKGYFIAAATARPPRGIKFYSEKIGLDGTVELNGAIVRCGGGEILYNPIDGKCGKSFLSRLIFLHNEFKNKNSNTEEIKISVETGDNLYCNFDLREAYPGAIFYEGFPELPEKSLLHKISIGYNFPEVPELVRRALSPELYTTLADNKLFQIMSKDASKWNGIRFLLSKNGILPEEAVFFGDDNDDVEPMQKCGLGAAVENAADIIKSAADIVVASNENDGVAEYIEMNLL